MLTRKHWWANVHIIRNLQAKFDGSLRCDRCKLHKPDVSQLVPLWINIQACSQCIDEINTMLKQSPVLGIIQLDHPITTEVKR